MQRNLRLASRGVVIYLPLCSFCGFVSRDGHSECVKLAPSFRAWVHDETLSLRFKDPIRPLSPETRDALLDEYIEACTPGAVAAVIEEAAALLCELGLRGDICHLRILKKHVLAYRKNELKKVRQESLRPVPETP